MLAPLCKTLIVLLLFCVCARPVQGAESQRLFAALQQAAGQTETLFSRFVQEKHLAIFAETLVSEGVFAYRRPDHLRWELQSPLASGFVLRAGRGERWNQLSGERTGFNVDSDPIMGLIARQLLAWARVDLEWLQQRYRIEVEKVQPVSLRLTPVDPGEARFIRHLNIQFDPDRRYVAEVLMVETGGDSTRLRFNEVQINGELPPASFQPPEF